MNSDPSGGFSFLFDLGQSLIGKITTCNFIDTTLIWLIPSCKSVPEFKGLEKSEQQGSRQGQEKGFGYIHQQYHNVKIMVTNSS